MSVLCTYNYSVSSISSIISRKKILILEKENWYTTIPFKHLSEKQYRKYGHFSNWKNVEFWHRCLCRFNPKQNWKSLFFQKKNKNVSIFLDQIANMYCCESDMPGWKVKSNQGRNIFVESCVKFKCLSLA